MNTIRLDGRAIGVALVALLVGAGCGSSGEDDNGDDGGTEDDAVTGEQEAAAGEADRYEAGSGLCDSFDHGPFVAIALDDPVATDFRVPDLEGQGMDEGMDEGMDDGRIETRCQLRGPADAAEGDPSVAMDIDARFMASADGADNTWESEAEEVGEDLYEPFDPVSGDPWTDGRIFSSVNPGTAEQITTLDLLDGNLFLTCRLQRFHAPEVSDEQAAEACATVSRDIFAHHLVDG